MATDAQVTTRRIASVNPATGEILREFPCADEAEVRASVDRARAAQAGWREMGIRQRVRVIADFQRRLLERKSEVAALITREAGKPIAEALTTEVLVVLDTARFLIANAYRLLADEKLPHGNLATKLKRGRLVREPYGVIGIISPWNYPFSIPATETLAALVAGNAVVLKPSELTPLAALELASLLHAAGVPEDVFQVLIGDGATGAALLGAPIQKLIFTGSVATGKRIAAAAAERLLPVVLELGGKDPMIILDDADVDVASSAAVWGAFVNAGQTCLSVERCYVHRSLHDQFVAGCVAKTKQLKIGRGDDPATDVGPMIHERQLKIVEDQVKDAKAGGALVVTGGARMPELGVNFYQPTVLTGVTQEMRIMRDETFGPVLPIAAFDGDEEAIALANDSEYGLSASVWTRDRRRGERVALRIQAGTVMLNDTVSCFGISEAPHGGVKSSGLGRTHGRLGLEEMVQIKHVDCDLAPGMKKVWWYGYGGRFREQMEGFLDMQFGRGMARVRGAWKALPVIWRKRP